MKNAFILIRIYAFGIIILELERMLKRNPIDKEVSMEWNLFNSVNPLKPNEKANRKTAIQMMASCDYTS